MNKYTDSTNLSPIIYKQYILLICNDDSCHWLNKQPINNIIRALLFLLPELIINLFVLDKFLSVLLECSQNIQVNSCATLVFAYSAYTCTCRFLYPYIMLINDCRVHLQQGIINYVCLCVPIFRLQISTNSTCKCPNVRKCTVLRSVVAEHKKWCTECRHCLRRSYNVPKCQIIFGAKFSAHKKCGNCM